MRRRGAPPFEVEHAIGMAAYLASGADGAPTNDVRRLTGRPPRSLEQFFKTRKAHDTDGHTDSHIALRVPDLDASVAFQQDVLGMVETERSAGVSYLTCNERHHELMLIQDPVRRGYDHIALEVGMQRRSRQ